MKFYGLELKGQFWVQRQPDLTDNPWTSEDEGRLVYNEADDILYYGGDREWVQSTQSRYTFNVGQQIIFGAPASGGVVIPDDWNIVDDIDDKVPMITNIANVCGQRGGSWSMDDIMTSWHGHNHFTPDQLGLPSSTAIRGTSEIYSTVAIDTHKHTISYDSSHSHDFDDSWRFPVSLWTVGEYQP